MNGRKVAAVLGLAGIALFPLPWFVAGDLAVELACLGALLVLAALLVRVREPDSRYHRGRSGPDGFFGMVAGGALVAALYASGALQPHGGSHHNDGGDVVFELVALPFLWVFFSLPLSLWLMGCRAPEPTQAGPCWNTPDRRTDT